MNLDLIPDVMDKTLKKSKFDGNLVYKSLLKETDISEKNAKKVVMEVVRKIIGMSSLIIFMTSPMIREITNVTLLQFGLEKERLQYTRIGFPRYDLKKIIENNNKPETDIKILKHIKNEYFNVENLIKTVITDEKNNSTFSDNIAMPSPLPTRLQIPKEDAILGPYTDLDDIEDWRRKLKKIK